MSKKLTRTVLAFMLCIMMMPGIVVHAESSGEIEPNNSLETAQTIQANYETAAQAVSGSRPNQHVITGYTSSSDVDWFKVYLNAGTQYMTCNDHSFLFTIYDPNGNVVQDDTYVKTGFGPTAYDFDANETGYYYVRIQGITSSSVSYLFLIGGPTYSVANCQVNLPSVTMTSTGSPNSSFDLSTNSNLPNGAVVYSILMNGVRSNDVRSISVRNLTSSTTVNLPTYTWNKSGLVSLNMPLKAGWQITYGYNKNVTFNPSIKLYYAYPIVDSSVDDITITNP